MPNPLTLMTAATTSTVKPEADAEKARHNKAGAQFQDVLDQQDAPPELEISSEDLPEDQDAPVAAETDIPPIKGDSLNQDVTESDPAPRLETQSPVEVEKTELATAPTQTQPGNEAIWQPQQGRGGADIPPDSTHSAMPNSRIEPADPTQQVHPKPQGETLVAQKDVANRPDTSVFAMQAVTAQAKDRSVQVDTVPADTAPDANPTMFQPQKSERALTYGAAGISVAQLQLTASARQRDAEQAVKVDTGEPIAALGEEPVLQSARDSAAPLSAPAQAARAEVARAIAGQMAAAIQARAGSGAIEIALNPEELGRVSIILNGREDGFHLTIAAERPETLDLMRRHIAVLSEEFQKLGYGDLSFDLGNSSDSQQNPLDHQQANSFDLTPQDLGAQAAPFPKNTAPGRGVDMRL
ncbi:flagellar hook-length control protein FliK [Ruegeria sp. SCPT10]|uniref:flagellar hook-length control protein FliK n=1 Tax=Ruegeria sp. SCP10 TaxID=3141377 RepID=UPI00333C82F8